MRLASPATRWMIVVGLAAGVGGCATAPRPARPPSSAICGFSVVSERAALRVRGVFAGMAGDVARRTAAPGTEDGFVFDHPAQSIRVHVAQGRTESGSALGAGGQAGDATRGWTATLKPRTDVRVVRRGTSVCVFTRTVVDGPAALASLRDDVHDGVALPMLARLEHEMRIGW